MANGDNFWDGAALGAPIGFAAGAAFGPHITYSGQKPGYSNWFGDSYTNVSWGRAGLSGGPGGVLAGSISRNAAADNFQLGLIQGRGYGASFVDMSGPDGGDDDFVRRARAELAKRPPASGAAHSSWNDVEEFLAYEVAGRVYGGVIGGIFGAAAPRLGMYLKATKGSTNLISQFSSRTIDDAVNLIMKDPNKVRHLFPAKHNLGSLVNKLGGQENTVRAVLNAANGKLPASGVFKNIPVNVGGQTVLIRGNVINGVPRLGTMFIP